MFPTHVDVEKLQAALGNDLLLFLPELAVCAGVSLVAVFAVVSTLKGSSGPFFTASTRARFCFAFSYAGSAVTALP